MQTLWGLFQFLEAPFKRLLYYGATGLEMRQCFLLIHPGIFLLFVL